MDENTDKDKKKELVPNDPSDPRYMEFWDMVRELTCPTETFYGPDDD